jgi:hypothetical protein
MVNTNKTDKTEKVGITTLAIKANRQGAPRYSQEHIHKKSVRAIFEEGG